MHPPLGNGSDNGAVQQIVEDLLGDRIEALASWVHELDAQIHATTAAADEKALKELRRALEAWSKRDPKFEERLTERVDVLADRLATLSSTVNMTAAAHAGADGELASLRRELEQETAKLRATLRDRGPAADAAAIEELRRAVAELSAERSGKPGERSADGLLERIDNIGERVDTLAKTVASTAAGLAGREGDVAALRRSLDDLHARIDALVASLRATAQRSSDAELLSRVEAVAGDLHGAEEQLTAELRSLAARLEERSGTLEAKIEDASADFSAKELELAALKRHLEETGARVEAALREIRESASETASVAEVDERIAPLRTQIETLAARLQESDTFAQERLERELARLSEVERRLESADRRLAEVDSVAGRVADVPTSEELEERLAALQHELDATGARLDAAVREVQTALLSLPDPASLELDARLEPLSAGVETLSRRLVECELLADERAAETASRSAEIDDLLAAGARRLEALEQRVEGTAAEIARAASTWSEEQLWVREQLDALVQAVSETPRKAEVDEPLAALSARLDELSELAAPIPPSEDEALKRLLVAVADRIEAIEKDRAAATRAARATENGLAGLRTSLERLEARLASTEELLADDDSPELEDRLEALSTRLAALEAAAKAPPSAAAPVPGDGRFRVELRALELRMQHAEAAARENREAVLVQLERLAARLEWPLQRLESEQPVAPEAPAEPAPLGQVVPIRGRAET